MTSAGPSATARLIAAATVMRAGAVAADAPLSGAAQWCERCLSTNTRDRLLLWSVRHTPGRWWWSLLEAAVLPGTVNHWMRRKRVVDGLARQATAQGFTQLLVLGCGLDSLAFRLRHENTCVRAIAADQPGTVAHLRNVVSRGTKHTNDQKHQTEGVELATVDLSKAQGMDGLLASGALDIKLPTLVVIEGVLMYLPEPAVRELLIAIGRFPMPRLQLVASWMRTRPGRGPGFQEQSRALDAWLRLRGEPMRWSSTPGEVESLATACGWRSARVINFAGAEGGLESEQLVVADR